MTTWLYLLLFKRRSTQTNTQAGIDSMLQVINLTTVKQFRALEDEWRELSAQCPTASIFNGWDWLWNWWQVYGLQQPLALITVRDECGQLQGILPLYIAESKALKLAPVRELRLIGTGGDTSPDYLGPLYRSDCGDSLFTLMCEAIDQLAAWDVARFTDLTNNTAFCNALAARFGELDGCAQIRFIQLPSSFGEYLGTLSSNQRKQVRRRRRRFEEMGETRFYRWPATQAIDSAFDSLVALHNKRWDGVEDAGSFNTSKYLAFHRAVMQALHTRDELRLYCLELNEQMIAMEYSYKWNDTIYSFQCGYDPQFSELRPGQLLLNYSIENAIEEGLKEYDMLKGDYDYKVSAAKDQRETRSLQSFRVTGAGRLASFSSDLSALKQRLRG
ncbi:MAG: GNAT family N-acetyltransferase [Pseudomonadales bacterium]